MMNFSSDKTVGIFSTPANKKIITTLKESRVNVIEFDYEKFVKREFDNKNAIFEGIKQFDWIVFTNIFAADLLLEELETSGFDLFEMDNIKVCSFGEAVADRLRFVQLHSDIISQKIDEIAIAESILSYDNRSKNIEILVVKTQPEKLMITENLRRNKINAVELFIAEMENNKNSEQVKRKALLRGGAIDDFIFGSVKDVFQFKFQFTEEFADSQIFETIWGADEITLKTLDEFGIKGFYLQK